jgi:hypothetical protein
MPLTPLNPPDVTAILAVIIVAGGGAAIALGHGDNPIFTMAISGVLGFYFGRSSKGAGA